MIRNKLHTKDHLLNRVDPSLTSGIPFLVNASKNERILNQKFEETTRRKAKLLMHANNLTNKKGKRQY